MYIEGEGYWIDNEGVVVEPDEAIAVEEPAVETPDLPKDIVEEIVEPEEIKFPITVPLKAKDSDGKN